MKEKTKFFCTECGNETFKWFGRCPACGQWNTLVEAPAEQAAKSRSGAVKAADAPLLNRPRPITDLDGQEELRFSTGLGELDRVLGGGAVIGSIVLVGGAPGIGKSTLLLQICGRLEGQTVLYVTGEESARQLKLRARRLGVEKERVLVLAETNLDNILRAIEDSKPDVVIIDSIQTVFNGDLSSGPGSVSQVKDCTMALMRAAKQGGFTCFVVGHVNKEGAIAGPKVLEHMVDCVLYFEGDRALSYRILRAAKNRFGSTNEIGVFEMADKGLVEVPNPSEMLLSGRPKNSPGTCVTCVMEGSRPILAEVQALVAPSGYGSARRNSNGFDYNRAMLLLAVLEKRGGFSLSSSDVYINVIGGLELDEPAADLATVLSIVSSAKDRVIPYNTTAIGEVGLTGEIRSVSALNQRLTEVARLGFQRCVIPAHVRGEVKRIEGLEIVSVRNVREAVRAVLDEAPERQQPTRRN
ncbi:MAG: DNA repair protein RadA [Oscillospiraceae bacterium]|nr:DNA repair protein RadA [Oscillospiraceae bacterium]